MVQCLSGWCHEIMIHMFPCMLIFWQCLVSYILLLLSPSADVCLNLLHFLWGGAYLNLLCSLLWWCCNCYAVFVDGLSFWFVTLFQCIWLICFCWGHFWWHWNWLWGPKLQFGVVHVWWEWNVWCVWCILYFCWLYLICLLLGAMGCVQWLWVWCKGWFQSLSQTWSMVRAGLNARQDGLVDSFCFLVWHI